MKRLRIAAYLPLTELHSFLHPTENEAILKRLAREFDTFGLLLIANNTGSHHGVYSDGASNRMQEMRRIGLLDGIAVPERPLRRLCKTRSG